MCVYKCSISLHRTVTVMVDQTTPCWETVEIPHLCWSLDNHVASHETQCESWWRETNSCILCHHDNDHWVQAQSVCWETSPPQDKFHGRYYPRLVKFVTVYKYTSTGSDPLQSSWPLVYHNPQESGRCVYT